MPTLLDENERMALYQLDNGQTVQVAKNGLASFQPPANQNKVIEELPAEVQSQPLNQGTWEEKNYSEQPPLAQPQQVIQQAPQQAQPVQNQSQQQNTIVDKKESPSILERGFQRQVLGAQQEAAAAYKAGQAEAQVRQGYADQLRETQEKRQAQFQEANQATDLKLKDYERVKNDYSQTSLKDPWAQRSTGSKIGAAIAIGLGAFGSAYSGQPNYALNIINDSIQRDLAIQAKNLDQKRELVGEAKSAIDLVKQQFSTKDQQLLALQGMALDATINQIQGIQASAKGEEAKAKAQQLAGALDVQRVKTYEDLKNSMLESQLKAAQAQFPGGKPEKLPTTAIKEIADLETAVGLIDKLEDQYKSIGEGSSIGQFIPGSKTKRYLDKRDVTTQTVGVILELGKLTDTDYSKYKEFFPDATDSKQRALEKIATLRDQIINKRNQQIKTYGQAGFSTGSLSNLESKSDQKQKIVEWAIKNRGKDPRADQILSLYGG